MRRGTATHPVQMQLLAAPHLPCVEIPGRGLQIDFTTVPCVATRDAWGRKVCGDVGQCGIIKLVVHDMLRDVWSSASQHAMHTKHFDIDIVSVRRKAVQTIRTIVNQFRQCSALLMQCGETMLSPRVAGQPQTSQRRTCVSTTHALTQVTSQRPIPDRVAPAAATSSPSASSIAAGRGRCRPSSC